MSDGVIPLFLKPIKCLSLRFTLTLIALLMCTKLAADPKVQPGKPNILTSIRPLALLTKDLVGDLANVDVLLPGNMDPHNATLRYSDREKLSSHDLLVWLGPDLEMFLAKASSNIAQAKQLRLDQLSGIDWLQQDDHHRHSDLADGKDVHIWLNPQNAIVIVTALNQFLSVAYPDLRSPLAEQSKSLINRLTALDDQIQQRMAPLKNRGFGVYHDAYGHFISRYQLTQIAAVNQMPEQALSARRMAELSTELRGAACLLTERQGHSSERLSKRIGIPLVLADPLASDPTINSYSLLLLTITRAFEGCLGSN